MSTTGTNGDDPVRLSVTSYVVLGMVALRGPSTPYDLKRAIGRSIGYFWPFPHAQLYSEPARLVDAGLLEVSQESTGRRRKEYAITSAGMRSVREWLSRPVGEPFQLRNGAEIKLFFGELAKPDDLVALADEQVRLHEERMAEYRATVERFADQAALKARLVPLELGVRLEQTALEFWREVRSGKLPGPDVTKPSTYVADA